VFTGVTLDNYTYCPTAEGKFNITVVITDGEKFDSESWMVTVRAKTPITSTTPSGTMGGGALQLKCEELWVCTDWSACLKSGVQTRECKDLHKCGTIAKKPSLIQGCIYTEHPTCFDGIKNQDEILPDCGGKICPPCPTCDDGIQNQAETGIDCGGPCPVCKEVLAPPEIEKRRFKLSDLWINLDKYWVFWLLISVLVLSAMRLREEISKSLKRTYEKNEKTKVQAMKKQMEPAKISESRISVVLKSMKTKRLLAKAYKEIKRQNYAKANELYAKAKELYNSLPNKEKAKIRMQR